MQVYLCEIFETSERLRRNSQLRAFRARALRVGRSTFVVEGARRRDSMKAAIFEQCELKQELQFMSRNPDAVSVMCLSGLQRGLTI